MNKKEFVELLESLDINCNEGIQNMKNHDKLPRVVYFEYVWEPVGASGREYDTLVTYQVSFFSLIPRDSKLILLKNKLNDKNIMPLINHEYIEDTREFHSYFKVEVLEHVS